MEQKEKSTIRAVKMDNLRSFLGIMRIDRVPRTGVREFCGEEVDQRIHFSHQRSSGRIF